MVEFAAAVVADAGQAGAVVIINDRADVAVVVDAHGVHVGQDDLPAIDARTVVGADRIVGLSTHTESQLRQGLDMPISYLAVGPVFDTETKATGYDSIGLETVRRAAAIVDTTVHPLVAIGGITLQRAPGVIAAGASSVAVISDLLEGDPEARAREFLRALQ
jgi:thiamine-phosphate pyrophosphorylase